MWELRGARRRPSPRTAWPSPAPTVNTPSSTLSPAGRSSDSRRVWDCVRENIAEVAAKVSNDPCRGPLRQLHGRSRNTGNPGSKGAGPVHSVVRYAWQRIYQKPGTIDFPGRVLCHESECFGRAYFLPKLLWRREHQPELYQQADKFLLWGDLLRSCWAVSPSLIIPSPIAPFFSTFTSKIGRIDCWP